MYLSLTGSVDFICLSAYFAELIFYPGKRIYRRRLDMLKFEEKEFSIKDDPENVFHVCHVEGMTKKDFYNMFQGDHGHYKIDEHLLTQLEMVAS